MIFAIGVVCFLLGKFIINVFGTGFTHVHNTADYTGVLVGLTGIVAVVYSVLKFVSQYLP